MASNNSLLRRKILIVAAVLVCAGLAYLGFGELLYYWKEYVHHDEVGTISELLALRTMQDNFRKDHLSYAANFAELGIPLGASLHDGTLTWGAHYQYRFAQTVRDQAGQVVEYSIIARPVQFSSRSKRSYLMDQQGIIHFTSLNRDARNDDPLIGGQE